MSDAGNRPIFQLNVHNHWSAGNVNTGPNIGSINQSIQASPARGLNVNGVLLPHTSVVGRNSARTWLSISAVIYSFLSPISIWRKKYKLIPMDSMDQRTQPRRPAMHEIYIHTLLLENHGLPCWNPAPSDNTAQPRAVVPGDVGTYTAEGGFHRIFNLLDDAHFISKIPQTILPSPRRACREPARASTTQESLLMKGETMGLGASTRKLRSPHRTDVVYEFQRDSRPGAILALTSSADREETNDISGMEEYIHQHAEAIYRHAIATGKQSIREGESIYIVTGCIKSGSCAMAAYNGGVDGTDETLLLEPVLKTEAADPPIYVYDWTNVPRSSRARVGKSSQEGVKDQSLFLLGFKLAFSPRFHSRFKAGRLEGGSPNSPGSEGQDAEDFDHQPGAPGHGPPSGGSPGSGSGGVNTSGQSGPSGHDCCTRSYDIDNVSCMSPPCKDLCDTKSTPHAYHPSDIINALLLQQTDCDIAVCHDDSWRFLLKSCHSLLTDYEDPLTLEDLSMKIGQSGTCTIRTEGGVTSLLPDGYETEQGERISTFKEVDIANAIPREGPCSPKPSEAVAGKSVPETGEARGEQQGKPHVDSCRKEAPQPSPLCAPDTAPPSNCSKAFSGQASPLLRTDIIVLVMGLVGAGRSTFINALLPEDTKQLMDVGTSLAACTTTANCVILDSDDLAPILGNKPSYRLVLVDTPGFDSGYTSDSEGVLKEIVVWASKWLPGGQKRRGGVILMHDLTADRLQGQRDLVAVSNIFTARSASDQVVGVTSKWRNVPNISGPLPEGDRRHRIVQQEIKHVTFHKFREEVTDAREIMKGFLPSIEQGSELDFGKAFEEMKSRKVKEESSYKKKMRRFLSRLVGFFRSLWRTADAA